MRSYGLPVEAVTLLGVSENHGYRVDCRDGSARFARVHTYGERDPETLPAEADFLDRLHHLVPSVAPVVQRTNGGEAFLLLPDGRSSRMMVFNWVEGKHRDYGSLTIDETLAMAETTAYFHLASRRIREPFRRPRYDYDYYCGPGSFYARADRSRRISDENMAPFLALKKKFRAFTERHGDEETGMIHYDLHLGNFLFDEEEEARIIDFDECGCGYYLFDLGHILFALQESPRHVELERLFVERYERITARHVPRDDLQLFKGVQAVAIVNYFFRLIDRSDGRRNLTDRIPAVAQSLSRLLHAC